MKDYLTRLLFLLFMTVSFSAHAVYLNQDGLGEVLLVPYYTVNNDLNTLVNLTNTTNDGKAIKINIREGHHGYAVLSYNVYLAPHDSWVFALIPTTSTMPDYENQASALHITPDNSCAPFLNKNGQEILPYELIDGLNEISRGREGFIEVIEMGTINPSSNLYRDIEPGGGGVPFACEAVMAAWPNGGEWTGDDLLEAQGGLSVETSLINVAEGINYSYPAVALGGFFTVGGWEHANPWDTSLSLDKAEAKSTIVNGNQVHQLSFDRGVDAVSALLMTPSVSASYALPSFLYGQTEMAFTFPTRRFYFNVAERNDPPFQFDVPGNNDCYDRFYGGSDFSILLHDRESQRNRPLSSGTPRPPEPPPPSICGTTTVFIYKLPGDQHNHSEITQSLNSKFISTVNISHATESGFVNIAFLDSRDLVAVNDDNQQPTAISGLPVVGVKFHRFTNAGAQEGLLAQYGGAELLRTQTKIISE